MKKVAYGCAKLALAAFVLLLAACGGGGGGGGGGSDLSTAPGLALSPTSLTFSAIQNDPLPSTQNVQVTITNPAAIGIIVGFPTGVTPPTWFDQNSSFSCTPSLTFCTLGAAINTTSLPPGTYTTTLRFVIGDTPQHALAFRDLPISYTIQPRVGFGVSPTSLSFAQLQGAGTPTPQSLALSELAGASYVWNASINYASGSGWLTLDGGSITGGAGLPATISVGISPQPALGTLNATIHLTGNGHTRDVPVSYTVSEPSLSPAPATLTFSAANQGATPATQDVTLSTQGSLPLNYTTSVTYGAGASGWLNAPASGSAPGPLTVGVNTTNLPLGTYTATLFVKSAAQNVPISITYGVVRPSLTFSPPSPTFTITTASLPASLSQTVGVGSTGTPLSWTATSSQPWVSVAPASGTSGAPVTLSLDPTQLDTLDAGSRSATITFAYTPPGGTATTSPLSVTLDLQIPKVTSVNPYVATSGTSLGVILRGTGFSNPGATSVDFAGTAGTNATVVSDTELRVTHPSLTAGSYRVSIPNNLGNPGIVRSTANLVVGDAPVYAAATIAYPAIPAGSDARVIKQLIYDAERKALLVMIQYTSGGFSATSREIHRYAFNGSSWSTTPTVIPIAFAFGDMAATLDGKTLLVTNTNAIQEYDMATLMPGASTSVALGSVLSPFLDQLAVANDGNALVTSGIFGSGFTPTFAFSVANRTFTPKDSLFHADAGGSADGSLLVLSENGLSPPPAQFAYNASTSTLSPTVLNANLSFPALDRSATRILLGGFSVYDSGFQLLGGIGGSSPQSQALSPDGKRAYAADRISGGVFVPTRLRTFDLTAPLVAGQFPEIIGSPTSLPSDTGTAVMTVSPDGGTVFIAGTDSIVVVPAP